MKHQTIQNASREIVPGENDDTLLSPYWKQVREKLFPLIQEETGLAFTQKLKSLAQILEIVRIEQLIPEPQRGKRGGQEIDRRPLARAFVVKAFFNLSQTRALKEQLDQSCALRNLCGMETAPSEATFSRAFSEFAQMGLGQLAHAALVEKFVSSQIVTHVSHDAKWLRHLRDSTALEAREKASRKVEPPKTKEKGKKARSP